MGDDETTQVVHLHICSGTGLSIALIMTLFIIFYVKFTPIYPEYNRDRILVIKSVKRVAKKNSFNWSLNHGTTYYMVNELLKDLPHLEACAAVFSGTSWLMMEI